MVDGRRAPRRGDRARGRARRQQQVRVGQPGAARRCPPGRRWPTGTAATRALRVARASRALAAGERAGARPQGERSAPMTAERLAHPVEQRRPRGSAAPATDSTRPRLPTAKASMIGLASEIWPTARRSVSPPRASAPAGTAPDPGTTARSRASWGSAHRRRHVARPPRARRRRRRPRRVEEVDAEAERQAAGVERCPGGRRARRRATPTASVDVVGPGSRRRRGRTRARGRRCASGHESAASQRPIVALRPLADIGCT